MSDSAASGRAFILMRQDEPGEAEGYPVAVYVDAPEAAKRHREEAQAVNPNSHYYWIEKPLNPRGEA